MSIQNYVAEQTERIADALAHFLASTAPDKRDWRPEESTRSALQQAGECVIVNRYMAALLRGETISANISYEMTFESLEEAQSLVRESAAELANAIRNLRDADLERIYAHPRAQIVGKNLILMPFRNMAYHSGQINFLQTLYGDSEFHAPPTWR